MTPTSAQQLAIEHRGTDLLVAASAGSGKTETLARRCAALVAGDAADARGAAPSGAAEGCEVEQLLVVTFTRAAAAELRARIARMLRARAAQEPLPARRARLRSQVLRLPSAEIGTLDAWCGRLVREFYAEAGVDAEFAVLGAEAEALLRAQCLAQLFDALYLVPRAGAAQPAAIDDGPDPALATEARDWLRAQPRADDAFLRELVCRLNEQRGQALNPAAWLARVAAEATGTDEELQRRAVEQARKLLLGECRFQAGQLASLLSGAAEFSPGGDAPVLRAYARQLSAWSEELERLPPERSQLMTLLEAITRYKGEFKVTTAAGRMIAGRWYTGRLLKRADPEEWAALIEAAPLAARRLRTLCALEACYHRLVQQAKQARRAWGFQDIQRMALDLLSAPAQEAAPDAPRVPTPLAERLSRRYAHVLVDEYQDTSPLQVELLRLVTRDNGFFVGDVKQSIYGFRRAEPRLFTEQIEAYSAARRRGRTQYLSDNFRSHVGVVEPLNELFARLFSRDFGGTDYGREERLTARRAELPNPGLDAAPRLEFWLAAPPDEDEAESSPGAEAAGEPAELELEQIEREARLAAAEIIDLRARGVCIPERGPDGNVRLRSLRLSDVVILVRAARQNAVRAARILRDQGLACQTSGRDSLLDAHEVVDLLHVLRLLTNRRQDIPMAAYLRSPLTGMSEAELLALRQARPAGSFADAVLACAAEGPDDLPRERVRTALARLDAWTEAAREEELPALLRRIVRETSYRSLTRGLPQGAQRVAALDALLNAAEDFVRTGRHGPAAFVEHLDALAAEEVAAVAPQPAAGDAVRILTIHAAKGLEFPVVFLLNAGAKFNQSSQAAPLQADEHGRCGWRGFELARRQMVASAAHLPLRLALQQRELEEELRLLYVAATRAREKFYLVGRMTPAQWDEIRGETPPGNHVALISRLTARHMLEWALRAAAAARLPLAYAAGLTPPDSPSASAAAVLRCFDSDSFSHGGGLASGGRASASETDAQAAAGSAAAATDSCDAEEVEWVRTAHRLILARPDTRAARLPAAVSVSLLKGAREDPEHAPAPPELPEASLHVELNAPLFAARAAPGRIIGTAVHRFLQFADLSRLTAAAVVRSERDRLLAQARLTREDAELLPVDDLAWFGNTDLGRRLAARAGTVVREAAFVLALPVTGLNDAVIVRGVIDCLLPTPEGVEIIDYKTDQPVDAADSAARRAAYSQQLGYYAAAAEQILQRPVTGATLVFLRQREIVRCAPRPVCELLMEGFGAPAPG